MEYIIAVDNSRVLVYNISNCLGRLFVKSCIIICFYTLVEK